ncbi:MAG: FUSC family protein [Clostridia bacterium]
MSNTIVAVAIVVIALTLVSIDLTQGVVQKTFWLSIFTLVLGVGASIAVINPLVGLIVNSLIIFYITYQGMHSYKPNIYFPFILAYMFMLLSVPVSFEALPLRLISIIIGCSYILIIQVVLNRNRFNKTISGTRKALILNITRQIDSMIEGNDNSTFNMERDVLINTSVKAIYDTKLKSKYITVKNKGNLEVTLALQNIGQILSDFSRKDILEKKEKNFLVEIKEALQLLDEYFYGSTEKKLITEKVNLAFKKLDLKTANKNILDLVEAIKKLPEKLVWIENNEKKHIPQKDLAIKNALKVVDIKSAAFKFGIKLALALSIVIFVVDVFDITYGRWIVFPMISIIQPYYEGTGKKAIDRIIGTVLGIIFFTVLFTFVEDNTVRLNIIIFLAYINLFVSKYHISTSLVAISALGSIAMSGGGIEILGFRILFTIIGCSIAMLINKYILHYTVEDSIKDLEIEYEKEILELNGMENALQDEDTRYNLILKTKLIEYKLNQSGKS